jgi:hypothetical protein
VIWGFIGLLEPHKIKEEDEDDDGFYGCFGLGEGTSIFCGRGRWCEEAQEVFEGLPMRDGNFYKGGGGLQEGVFLDFVQEIPFLVSLFCHLIYLILICLLS